jgi:uncharacterized cupin superfamily protein
MKEVKVVGRENSAELKGPAGNKFSVKEIVPGGKGWGCHANFVEVAPGETAYGYHWHEANEEVFCVLEGAGTVRTPEGELTVKAGEAITLPPGPEGAHVMMNKGKGRLVYVDFGVDHCPEIVHFPDAGQVWAIGRSGVTVAKE